MPPLRPMEHDYYPPPRDYDRGPRGGPVPPPFDPSLGDYRSDRRVPPPAHPHSTRSPLRFDPRDGPLPPPPTRRRDGYDDYRGAPPPGPPLDSRGKRRRSISPGPPPRRGEYDPYPPPRDGYRVPPPAAYRGEYPPPRPHSPPYGAHHRGPPGPSPATAGYYGRPPLPVSAQKEIEAPHHLPYVVTHRYFTDWFSSTNPPSLSSDPEALELAWKKYLAEHTRKSLRPTFEELKGMKWFEEKYMDGQEFEAEREKRRVEGMKGRMSEWCDLAEKGEWENITNDFDEEAHQQSSSSSTKPQSTSTTDQNGDTEMSKEKKPQPTLGDGLITLNSEAVLIPSRPNRVVVESIPSNVSYSELHSLFAPVEGFVRLSTSDGDSSADWTRSGWATFETEENATKAIEALSAAAIGEYKLILSKQDKPLEKQIRAAPSVTSGPDRIKKDLEIVESIVEYLERGQAEEEKKGSEVIRGLRESWEKEVEEKKGRGEEVTKEEPEVARKTLDFNLHYLRFAFNICYYCAAKCQSQEVLESVCPRHVRRVGPALPADVGFVKGLEEKVPLLDDHEKLDLRDFGAELREETIFSLCSPYIKNEEEGKFRCKECNKLFSARKFVEKHILTKHGQFVNDALSQAQFFNNYILDPAHHPLAEFQTTNSLPSLAPPPSALPLADRIGGRRRNGSISDGNHKRQKRDGPPPPPPKGAVLDPRAARQPTAYADLDGQPGGAPDVVELPY
ncbi:hypothetical protein JCM3765_005728 [Sporobolomyces pararoseus]